MNFCPTCGHAVTSKIPAGDNRLRYCCEGCGAIHYQNPRLVVGTVPIYGRKVLLCKRAIEPRHGYWTLPAGFMENGETVSQGAERETQEEAGAHIEMGVLFSVLDVPHVHQVHVFYLAKMLDDSLDPGEETLEAKLFDEADIPWNELAFPTVKNTLRWYFEDRASGRLAAGAATSEWAPHQKSLVPPLRPKA